MRHQHAMMTMLILIVLGFTQTSSAATFELEADPLAYLFSGHSIHGIYSFENGLRIDLGSFSMDIPENFEPDPDFDTKFIGAGLKVDYFGNSSGGGFAGAQSDFVKMSITETGKNKASKTITLVQLGGRVGYRFEFQNGHYFVSPWLGITAPVSGNSQIKVGESQFKAPDVNVFPTVHLGYRW